MNCLSAPAMHKNLLHWKSMRTGLFGSTRSISECSARGPSLIASEPVALSPRQATSNSMMSSWTYVQCRSIFHLQNGSGTRKRFFFCTGKVADWLPLMASAVFRRAFAQHSCLARVPLSQLVRFNDSSYAQIGTGSWSDV